MTKIVDLFAGIDLRAALAHTATIERPADIAPACARVDALVALDEAAEHAQAIAAAKTDLGVAAWIGAATAESPTPPKRRRRTRPAA